MSSGLPGSGSPLGRLRRRRSLNSLVVQVSALALSFVLIALLVVTSSRQAFVTETHSDDNTVTAAQIELTDDDSDTALFDEVGGLTPASPIDRCITVTYTGTVDPDPVRLYMPSAPTGGLAPYLTVTIDRGGGTTGGFRSCAGFQFESNLYDGTLPGFATDHPAYTSGLPAWDPSATGQTATFRFRVAVQDDQAAQGKSTTFGFTWETHLS